MSDIEDLNTSDNLTVHDTDLIDDPSQNSQVLTDSQFDDNDMFNLIKSDFGQLDRKSFKSTLLSLTDLSDLKPIRSSLFDIIRKNNSTYSDSKLVERSNKDEHLLSDKLADDIYVMFHYIEGTNNVSELRQCISRSACKRPPTVSDEYNPILTDIYNKLTNKAKSAVAHHDNTIIVSMLMEVKQMINDGLKPISEKVDSIVKNYEGEIKSLRKSLQNKDTQIMGLQDQLSVYRDRIAQLQADVKLKTQELKDRDEIQGFDKAQKRLSDRLTNKLDSIDNRLKQQSVKENKTTNSEKALDQIPQSIPVVALSRVDTPAQLEEYINTTACSLRNDHTNYEQARNDKQTCEYDNVSDATQYEHEIAQKTCEETDAFCGVVRRRTKRIVLYNVRADKSFSQVERAVRVYADQRGAHVTFTRLLKTHGSSHNSTYIMRVNINEDDFYRKIEGNEVFWPEGVYYRDYVPYNKSKKESQWGEYR